VLPNSNVYGPVVGLWTLSNPSHSPKRGTLFSLPYPLRTKLYHRDPVVPREANTFQAVVETGLCQSLTAFGREHQPRQSFRVQRVQPRALTVDSSMKSPDSGGTLLQQA
jgi:hypothetical protein